MGSVPLMFEGAKYKGGIVRPIPLELPQVSSSTLLLNLQADALTLKDGDPISEWINIGTLKGSFIQATDNMRPIYRIESSIPHLEFKAGGSVWLMGDDAWTIGLDNLLSFTVFDAMSVVATGGGYAPMLDKMFWDTGTGWSVDTDDYFNVWTDYDNYMNAHYVVNISYYDGTKHIRTSEKISNSAMKFFADGVDHTSLTGAGTVTSFSNSIPITMGTPFHDVNYSGFNVYGVLVYAPAPSASDRAAIEGWLAAKYGITL